MSFSGGGPHGSSESPFSASAELSAGGAAWPAYHPQDQSQPSLRQAMGPIALFALLILGADLLYLALHMLTVFDLADNSMLRMDRDRGHAEVFQYVKWLWMTGLCALAAWRPGHRGFIAWSLLFVALFLDDCFMLHESGGDWLARQVTLAMPFSLRVEDLGELLVWAGLGGLLLPLLTLGYYLACRQARALMGTLAALLGLLVVFGGVGDMIHIMVRATPFWNEVAPLVEEGGEMLVASLMLVVVFAEMVLYTIRTEPINALVSRVWPGR